jgi:hypothetical protein
MREEYINYSFWLLIVGSWVFGVAHGKWLGGEESIFAELGQAVSIPKPVDLGWWHPLFYFPLTIVATFVLSQLFFGGGAAIFMFSRGVCDGILFMNLESTISGWNLPTISAVELWTVFFIIMVLTVNLPLCLWAAHLGTRRSVRMFHRLRGRPLKPEAGLVSALLMLLSISFVIGLVGTLAISYTG